MPWLRIAAETDCPLGTALEVVAGGRIVALTHTAEGWFAIDGICAHQGGPLGQGMVAGCILTCPWHGWQYDVRSGQNELSPKIVQASFPVKVERGEVYVDLAAPS